MQNPDDVWRDIDILFQKAYEPPKNDKPWIQNVAAADVYQGWHYDPGANSMLIQILDPENAGHAWTLTEFPIPKHQFKEIYQFRFLDVDERSQLADEHGITNEQAEKIVALLKHALENGMHVVVHCHAGICRSGAVVEVATMMGFVDTRTPRIPNTLVKYKLMKVMGWTYE